MRRAITAVVIVVLVGAGGFALGYIFDDHAPPRPKAVPSASPSEVVVPKILHPPLAGAVQQVLNAGPAIGKVQTRTGGKSGTIVAQFPPPGTSSPPGSAVNLFVSTSFPPEEPSSNAR